MIQQMGVLIFLGALFSLAAGGFMGSIIQRGIDHATIRRLRVQVAMLREQLPRRGARGRFVGAR